MPKKVVAALGWSRIVSLAIRLAKPEAVSQSQPNCVTLRPAAGLHINKYSSMNIE